MNSGFRLIIAAKFNDTTTEFLELDTCFEKGVSASATIASQPLQSGNTMSDHMYRDPDKFTVKGKFSLNGRGTVYNNDYKFDGISNNNNRLTNIQDVFEYIKDNGILCDLFTLNREQTQNNLVQFKGRENMALQKIHWTESQNTLDFDLEFHEVIMVKLQEYEEYKADLNLPSLVQPSSKTLGVLLYESGKVDEIIISALISNGYITSDTLKLLNYVKTGFGTLAIGMIAGSALVALGVGAFAVGAAVPAFATGLGVVGFGLATAGISIAVIAVGIAIYTIIGQVKVDKKNKKIFKLIKNPENFIDKKGNVKNTSNIQVDGAEVNRLQNLIDTVSSYITKIFNNVTIYSISNVENDIKPCETVLNLGGSIYYIKFIKNNIKYKYSISPRWDVQVLDIKKKLLNGLNGRQYNTTAIVSDFTMCNRYSNMLFTDSSQEYEVYLFNPKIDSKISKDINELIDATTYLNNYFLIVSKGPIEENIKALEKGVYDALQNQGYL